MIQPLTIVYITHRKNPLWKYFVDGICRQADFDQRRHMQIIFVDGQLWDMNLTRSMFPEGVLRLENPLIHDAERRLELELIVNNRLDYHHIPPLPTTMQGPFRLTPSDWFCASNSRNTGFVAAKYPYVVTIDDLTCLGPQWLNQGFHAAQHGYTVAGMYKKVRKLVVDDGVPVSFEEFKEGIDSRWDYGSDNGIVDWSGSIFGCSFGIPTEKALAIDGFEMACCGSGNEDSDFGIRLRRAGEVVKLNRNMLTLESEEGHFQEDFKPMARRDRKKVSRDNLPAAYDSYQMPSQEEKYFSDHVLINRVINEARIVPLLPQNLRGIRDRYLHSGIVDIPSGPTRDWRDDSPLSQS